MGMKKPSSAFCPWGNAPGAHTSWQERVGAEVAKQKGWFSGEFTPFLRITSALSILLYEFLCRRRADLIRERAFVTVPSKEREGSPAPAPPERRQPTGGTLTVCTSGAPPGKTRQRHRWADPSMPLCGGSASGGGASGWKTRITHRGVSAPSCGRPRCRCRRVRGALRGAGRRA